MTTDQKTIRLEMVEGSSSLSDDEIYDLVCDSVSEMESEAGGPFFGEVFNIPFTSPTTGKRYLANFKGRDLVVEVDRLQDEASLLLASGGRLPAMEDVAVEIATALSKPA